MKILSSQQMKKVDNSTIENENILSVNLMERAANALCNHIISKHKKASFYVFCGPGNNGGDGLALSRLLQQNNYPVHTFLLSDIDDSVPDAKTNYRRLRSSFGTKSISKLKGIMPDIPKDVIIIDAIFGSGMNRPLEGDIVEVVKHLNNSTAAKKIAIDLPTGMQADVCPTPSDTIFKADETLSIQLPKLSFMFPNSYTYVGEFSVIDIKLCKKEIKNSVTHNYYVNKKRAKGLVRVRHKFNHKGNFGHALLIAGSYGKMGASILSSKACLRSGVGLLTTHIPSWGYSILQTAVPEAIASIDRSERFFTEYPDLETFSAIGIGPGINTKHNTCLALEEILKAKKHKPMVLDADALNIMAQNKHLLKLLNSNTVLTPHIGEFRRLVGEWDNDNTMFKLLKDFCKEYNVITVLKGAHSIICLPTGECFFNSTGNNGMATAGAGDVLVGIILSLLAQGYTSVDAAILGVYLHGSAGDAALKKQCKESLVASDIISNLANAFKQI